jgi:hypothetical protein
MRFCCLRSEVTLNAASAENAVVQARAKTPAGHSRAAIYKKFCVLCASFSLQLFAQQIAIKASRQTASCLSPHTALGESPRTSLPCKDSPKGAATEAFRGLLSARPPSLSGLSPPFALSLGNCPARICCSRDQLVRAALKEETRIRVCALVLQVLLSAAERLRGDGLMFQGASWTQGMCEGHSSRSIDMRLLAFGPWTGGTLLDGAYS